MSHPVLTYAAGWACLAPAGAIAAHSIARDFRRAAPVIARALRPLFGQLANARAAWGRARRAVAAGWQAAMVELVGERG